jgi:hypothetical protein
LPKQKKIKLKIHIFVIQNPIMLAKKFRFIIKNKRMCITEAEFKRDNSDKGCCIRSTLEGSENSRTHRVFYSNTIECIYKEDFEKQVKAGICEHPPYNLKCYEGCVDSFSIQNIKKFKEYKKLYDIDKKNKEQWLTLFILLIIITNVAMAMSW